MGIPAVLEYLLPSAERDEGFRQEILRRSRFGLWIVGAVEVFYPVFLLLTHSGIALGPGPDWIRMVQLAGSFSLGVATFLLGRLEWSYQQSRRIAAASAFLLGALLIITSLLLVGSPGDTEHFITRHLTLILLLVVAAVPLKPYQVLLFGAGLGLFFLSATAVFLHFGVLAPTASHVSDHWFMAVLTILATAVAALLYEQRRTNYRAYLDVLHAMQDLRTAQAKMLQSENASSLVRLAAALSHEFHSPLGVLRSSVDTLLALTERAREPGAVSAARYQELQAQLKRSVAESVDRLQQVIGRIQRFTNLDRAEIHPTNINDLLQDVAALLAPRAGDRVRVELRVDKDVPDLLCRPQHLSAAFAALLGNAIDASPLGGQVLIRASVKDPATVEVSLRDNGKGIAPKDLPHIFDPAFKESGGRISSSNWTLFSSRQLVRENGGDIHIESRPGEGTCVRVSLPLHAVPEDELPG
jgi:signal transduction histidine kinase